MNKNNVLSKFWGWINVAFMVAMILVMLLPYLHVLAKALNDGTDTMFGGITFYPRKLTFVNFSVLLNDASMIRAFFLSVARVILCTILGIIVQFSAAYALTRKDLPGCKQILLFLMIPMFFNGGIIPTYLLFVKVQLINNFWVYVLPGLCTFYNILIIKSYISASIPESIGESAVIDGANELIILFRIIFPLSLPVLATVALWVAVGNWNDWSTTLMYVTKEHLFTLQYKLMQLIKESERIQKLIQEAAISRDGAGAALSLKATPESLVSAQVIVTTIPIIIVYPFLQKYFIKGITLGAVKS
ncbi:MAG: carbohydrate ABC transporter permease [Firmicutes bacterium]|nr:carbohydrate ABC transporter permease [Bacillota bacterium]